MIMLAQVDPIYTSRYFGYDDMELPEISRCHGYLFSDGSSIGMVNRVMEKNAAKKKAKELYKNRNRKFSELWLSADAVRVKDIRDYLGEPVFKDLYPDISGWLVFYDPAIYMNWDHDCEYCLLVKEGLVEVQSHCRGLDEQVRMEKI